MQNTFVTYKALHGMGPGYLRDCLSSVVSTCVRMENPEAMVNCTWMLQPYTG